LRRVITVTVLAAALALAGAGCGGDDESAERADWDAAAAEALEALAAELDGAGLGCGDFAPYDFARIASDYDGKLPVPAAMGECTGPDDEHLEVAAFPDADATQAFVDEKIAFLCARAEEQGLEDFPGFPYVDAGSRLVQPDEAATARRVAAEVGGTARSARCD
jgi:hypothetical protein